MRRSLVDRAYAPRTSHVGNPRARLEHGGNRGGESLARHRLVRQPRPVKRLDKHGRQLADRDRPPHGDRAYRSREFRGQAHRFPSKEEHAQHEQPLSVFACRLSVLPFALVRVRSSQTRRVGHHAGKCAWAVRKQVTDAAWPSRKTATRSSFAHIKIDGVEFHRMIQLYRTNLGSAFVGDSLEAMRALPSDSVQLAVTSPPFPLTFRKKKPYESVGEQEFVDWFVPYSVECKRLLKPDGSFVIDLGGVWNKGSATKSLYQQRLLIALCDRVGFHFAQDFYWHNPAVLPAPAEWVNVRRIRVKSSVDLVFWLSKTTQPKADNRRVLRPYSRDMLRLIDKGYRSKPRPSGHNITQKFQKNLGGSIPPNLLEYGNNDSNSAYIKGCQSAGLPVHPARFPGALPEFFIKLCTEENDLVLDPFAGSNVSGEAAERLKRRWIAIELAEEYLQGSRFRFPTADLRQPHPRTRKRRA